MIGLSNPVLSGAERKWLMKCLDSGYVSSVGPMVSDFEAAFARKVGTRYAVATASGTAALHVALSALGMKAGAAVVVPDLTFVASMNPVLYCGAEAVLADVERATWCLDAEILRQLCRQRARTGNKVRAVIPVHLYGCCCDMEAIGAVAREYDLKVVEDATEALGTTFKGKQAGTLGDVGCFSFNGNKIMTTGAGGMVVTDSQDIADKVRYLVNQARDNASHYVHSAMGYNYRMNSLAAAVGMAQLEKLDGFQKAKRRIAARYRQALEGLEGLTLHPVQAGVDSNFWLYSLVMDRVKDKESCLESLNKQGIMARGFFAPLHRQPYVRSDLWRRGKKGVESGSRGNSDYLSTRGINLPSSSDLTESDQDQVITALLSFIGQ